MGYLRFAVLSLVVVLSACGHSRDSDDPAVRSTGSAPAAPLPPVNDDSPMPAALAGVDISGLANDEKREFFRIVAAVNSPCGEAVSIERCIRENTPCPTCRHAAKYAVRLLSEGYPADRVRDLLRFRYGSDTAVTLSTEGCAWRGGAMARVSIIEFADFECGHCKAAHESFDTLFEDATIQSSARMCYRFFPLEGHPNARPAAIAASAAMNQGKFWPMHDLLYEHQDELSPAAYLTFAGRIGLDQARFVADLQLPATEARIQRDRTEGEGAHIEGTPAIFVNGRPYEASNDPDSLRAYILEELVR